jgi:hypothetical protein
MLLRCIRRFRGAFTHSDADSVYDAEFTDRLGNAETELSVYAVSGDSWMMVFMCHRAAAGADPPRFCRAVDVSSVRSDSESDPVEDCPFSDIAPLHHILRFGSEAEVRSFVRDLAAAVEANPALLLEAKADGLKSWLRGQRRIGHAEWTAFLDREERWSRWSGQDSVPPPPP